MNPSSSSRPEDMEPLPRPAASGGDGTGTRHARARGRFSVATWTARAVVALTTVVAVAGILSTFAEYRTVCASGDCSTRPRPEWADQLRHWGLSTDHYAAFVVGLGLAVVVACCVLAVVLLLRRAEEPMALFTAVMVATFGATVSVGDGLAEEPGWRWAAAVVLFLGRATFFSFPFLFPDGRFVPRWAWVFAVGAVAYGAAENFYPGSVGSWPTALQLLPWFGLLLPGIFAQAYRYRRVSAPAQRQQTKWAVFGTTVALGGFLGLILLFAVVAPSLQDGLVPNLLGQALLYGCFLLIPVSLVMAVLRHRLWDIDLVINRALVYGALTALVVGLYVLVVGYLGTLFRTSGNLAVSLVATGVVAVLFQPMRDRLQRGVNRLTYGERDDPYAVLSRLGQRLEGTLAPDAALETVVETVVEALKLPYAAVELKRENGFRTAAEHGTPPEEPVVMPLTHAGEPVGHLLLAPRPGEGGFSTADRRLLEDLSRQAGAAAHAARLAADLQSSREELVSAREEERRRIRRDLHDGLGPRLAAQSLKAGSARALYASDPAAAAALLSELEADAEAAIAEIRRLVYDLRPPALDELGLAGALREVAARHGTESLRISVEASEPLPALPAAVEVAAYRIASEALANVARHANAEGCIVRLEAEDLLVLEVSDDGVGLRGDRKPGVGLRSMRERAEELGGALAVETTSVGGTKVIAKLPLPSPEQTQEPIAEAPEPEAHA